MDIITSRLNIEALKEPRGFIKIIQFFLAILAFATTTSLVTNTNYEIRCNVDNQETSTPKSNYKFNIKIEYAFDIESNNKVASNPCDEQNSETSIKGNFASAAQFYVFVGVMAFLYSTAAIVLYVFFSDTYNEMVKLPMIDFIVTCIFTLFWLIAASAWADNFTKLRNATDPETIFNQLEVCKKPNSCNGESGNFSKLYVSIMFGFLNVFVWGGNCWFLYKETSFFRNKQEPPPTSTSQDFNKPSTPNEFNQQQFPQGSM